MVSRFPGLGVLGIERAALGLVMIMACGFVDGDPIVTGLGSSGSTSGPTTTASTSPTGSAASGPSSGTADGSGTSEAETGTAGACACEGRQPGERCLRFINACEETVWAGASGLDDPAGALGQVGVLAPAECMSVAIREVAGGRAWGATDCLDGVCASNGNDGRGTLVQLSLAAAGADLYDVSLVDGFDLPMAMIPVGVSTDHVGRSECRPASCAADLTVVCPEELRRYDDAGAIAYCTSACRACSECPACSDCGDLGNPACDACSGLSDLCCTGQGCEPSEYTALWKSLCPDAITYAEEAAAFSCDQQPDYDIVFCP